MSHRRKLPAVLGVAVLAALAWLIISQASKGSEEQEEALSATSVASQPLTESAVPEVSPSLSSDPLFSSNAGETSSSQTEPGIPVELVVDATLYDAVNGEAIIALAAGGQYAAFSTEDPLWYSVTLDDGTEGYLYAEVLGDLTGARTSSHYSFAQAYLEEKIADLQISFPEGKYWNHMGQDIPWGDESPWIVTDIPCDHSVYGETYCNFYNGGMEALFPYNNLCECLGFASFLSDQLFGTDAPFHVFNDPEKLRVGDHIRLREYEHSMTVTAISDEGVTVSEVNQDYEDCLISWSRVVSWEDLYGLQWDSEYISRYPLYPADDGGFISWPEGTLPRRGE